MENLLKNCGTTVGLAVLLVSAGKTQKKKGEVKEKEMKNKRFSLKSHIFSSFGSM
jgi:hypothetical protein